MACFILAINCDTAIFEGVDDHGASRSRAETVAILRRAADQMEGDTTRAQYSLRDSNGNHVGWTYFDPAGHLNPLTPGEIRR